MTYPVLVDVRAPVRWERPQLALRVGLLVVLGILGIPLGFLFVVLYLVLPLVAALLISKEGPEGYLRGSGPSVARALAWWNAAVAYLLFLTDRMPLREEELASLRFEVAPGGTPTVGGALLRWITSLPESIVILLLAWVGALVWIVGAVVIAVRQRPPEFVLAYFRLLWRLQARLLAYHASLVDRYPPLTESSSAA